MTRQIHHVKKISKLALELNFLISVLQNRTILIGDGIKKLYFKRIDAIKQEMISLGLKEK